MSEVDSLDVPFKFPSGKVLRSKTPAELKAFLDELARTADCERTSRGGLEVTIQVVDEEGDHLGVFTYYENRITPPAP